MTLGKMPQMKIAAVSIIIIHRCVFFTKPPKEEVGNTIAVTPVPQMRHYGKATGVLARVREF